MKILVVSDGAGEYAALCEDCVAAVFKHLSLDFDVEVSLSVVSEFAMREINLQHRGIDGSTDVLSFPLGSPDPAAVSKNDFEKSPESGCRCLGDIVICPQKSAQQASEYGHSRRREDAFLLVHSILHLLGFDHKEKGQESEMFAAAEKILADMGITRGDGS